MANGMLGGVPSVNGSRALACGAASLYIGKSPSVGLLACSELARNAAESAR